MVPSSNVSSLGLSFLIFVEIIFAVLSTFSLTSFSTVSLVAFFWIDDAEAEVSLVDFKDFDPEGIDDTSAFVDFCVNDLSFLDLGE